MVILGLKLPAAVAVTVVRVLPSKAIVTTSDTPKLAPVTVTDVPGEPLAVLRERLGAAAKTIAELNVSNTETIIIVDKRVARSLIATLALFIYPGLLLNSGSIYVIDFLILYNNIIENSTKYPSSR